MPKKTHDGIKKRCEHPRRDWPKCDCPWHFSFHYAGREHRYSLDKIAAARDLKLPRKKADAVALRDALRGEIRGGTFVRPDEPVPTVVIEVPLTFGEVASRYLRAYVGRVVADDGSVSWTGRHLRKRSAEQATYHLNVIRRTEVPVTADRTDRLENRPLAAITKHDVEALREVRRPRGVFGTNRLLARLRHFFNWCIAEGYLETTPFKRGTTTVVKLEIAAEAARTRRLQTGEEEGLLQSAPSLLRALIVAALATGCREGELLSLQRWQLASDRQGRPWLTIPADKAKDGELRVIPVGTRLLAELSMRLCGPDGTEHKSDAYVFGNEVGEQVAFPKLAWAVTVLHAHGIEVTWADGGKTLSPESRAAYKNINLHFHDLRREFASRLRESGAPDHDVRDFLGHANITTTSRYLRSTPARLATSLDRLERAQKEAPADAFAQDSHTAPPAAITADAVPDAKLLN
jgi:integrase